MGGSSRRGAATLAVLSVLALSWALGSGASAARSTARNVSVKPTQIYTRTGIVLAKGESVEVSASGRIHFGGGKIAGLAPPGIPWGAKCDAVAATQVRKTPWPAPGLSCWSLVGRIGTGSKPFEIGSGTTFTAPKAGQLLLGLNDNYAGDNTGSWVARVTITPAVAAPSSSTTTTIRAVVPPVPAATSSGKSNTALFVLIGLAVVAALILLVAVSRRRKVKRVREETLDATTAPSLIVPLPPVLGVPVPALDLPVPEPGAEPEPEVPPEPVIPATPSAPPETDSIDVNIYEVEFTNGLTLRVGYNHFPEGTALGWKVTQNRVPVAAGSFVTEGGGSTQHLETVPLGIKLEGRDVQPDGADVQFDWTLNGVPFRYSVRRDPNC